MTDHVEVTNGMLDDWKSGEVESVVLRGTIVPDSLFHLQVPPYQREILSPKTIDNLKKAHREGRVPDVELGMRGSAFRQTDSGLIVLEDPVYIIDGLQRITAGQQLIQAGEDVQPHIGATIHFDTTEKWERRRFSALNLSQTKLSPNVTLRNLQEENAAVKVLYDMTTAPTGSFVLNGKISWEQYTHKGDMMQATTFLKSIGMLHSHLGPGRGSNVLDLANGLLKIQENVGKTAFRNNTVKFYNLIDEVWNIKRVYYRSGANFLKAGFLLAFAKLLSDHELFWDGFLFEFDRSLMGKLKSYPIDDPAVATMASSSSTHSRQMLYRDILDFINSGKRSRRLFPRASASTLQNDDVSDDGASDD